MQGNDVQPLLTRKRQMGVKTRRQPTVGVRIGMCVRSARTISHEAIFALAAQKGQVIRMLAGARVMLRANLRRGLKPKRSSPDLHAVTNYAENVGAGIESLEALRHSQCHT